MAVGLEIPSAESRGRGEVRDGSYSEVCSKQRVDQGRGKREQRKKRGREGGWGAGMELCVSCAFHFPARELLSPPSAVVTSRTRNDAMSNY